MVVVGVLMVVFTDVTVILWMSMARFHQPHLFIPVELSQFMRAVAHLLLCSPLVELRNSMAEARLRASFFGYMDESVWTGLL